MMVHEEGECFGNAFITHSSSDFQFQRFVLRYVLEFEPVVNNAAAYIPKIRFIVTNIHVFPAEVGWTIEMQQIMTATK